MLPSDGTPRVLTKLADSRSAEIYTWGEQHVVKLFRLGFPHEAIDREARNAAMIHALRIPTPKPEGTVEIKNRTGIIFERCEGTTLYEQIVRHPESAAELAAGFFELQWGLHQCRNPALPNATDRLEYAVRHTRVPDAIKVQALAAMDSLPRGVAVCHGDYHPINVLCSPNGLVALDWLDAGNADPMFDVARTLLYLGYARPRDIRPEVRRTIVTAYLDRCREAWKDDIERLDRWRLPVAVARLASAADEVEAKALLDHIKHLSAAKVR